MRDVLGSAGRALVTHRLRGLLLMGSMALTSGAAVWAATPVASTGQVVDIAGQPVPNVVVAAGATLLSPAGEVHGDARGRYRMGARRWPYRAPTLTVAAPGFVPARTTGGRLVLHRQPAVSGLVTDESGAAVAGAVVTLTSRAAVVGAAMTGLDGRFEMRGPAGDAEVAALAEQHDSHGERVGLAPDRVAGVHLTLARHFARLHVESDPAGQAPQLDGQALPDCTATPCDVTVTAGAHRVSFTGDQFVPWQSDVQVGRNEVVAVKARLERKMGTLTISAPGPGELAVDGQAVSGSPWSGRVAAGPHTVSFRSASTWPGVAHVDVGWNQTARVALAATPVPPHDAGAFAAGLRAYLGAQGGGSYGVYLEELRSGATIGVGDTAVLEAASVIKVPEAIYLLHQADAGRLALTDQVDLHPEDFMGGTGSLAGTAHPGDRYSYQQLLSVLIQQSDNTAWRALRRVLGDAQIDGYVASLAAGDCRQATDGCSARSAGHLMAQLARGRLLGAGSTSLLLSLLETTIFNDRINYYLRGVTIAHKVGMDPDAGVANDCGVVFLADDPFAICVFTTTTDDDAGAQVIRDVARAAARLY
jgi:Beta-lactamase enzyme family/Carboxypeptidase regulatory-like domain/PEGA domain